MSLNHDGPKKATPPRSAPLRSRHPCRISSGFDWLYPLLNNSTAEVAVVANVRRRHVVPVPETSPIITTLAHVDSSLHPWLTLDPSLINAWIIGVQPYYIKGVAIKLDPCLSGFSPAGLFPSSNLCKTHQDFPPKVSSLTPFPEFLAKLLMHLTLF